MTSLAQSIGAGTTPRRPPGPKGWPILGVAPHLLKDPLRLFDRVSRDFGDVTYLRGAGVYLVTDPELLQKIIIDDERNFSKNPEIMEKISPAIGEGLSTLIGQQWRQHRRIANPAFTRRSVESFVPIFHQSIRETMEKWDAQDGAEIDVTEEMKRLTLRIVIRCLFSTDIDAFSDEIIANLGLLQEYSVYRLWAPIKLPEFVPSPRIARYRRAKSFMERLIDGIIARRHAAGDVERRDLLFFLMNARDPETGAGFSDRKVRHEVMNMFLAGHETTANAVAFGLYLLATHGSVADRLRSELDGSAATDPSADDLARLDLNSRVLQESLRLYPSSWAMSRMALADYVYRDFLIPKGADIMIAQWCIHRSHRLWEAPAEFDPDRFLPARFEKLHKFAYLPFGAGARKCIGVHLAEAEGRMILAMLMRRYAFEPTENTRLNLVARLFMTSDPGVRLRIRRRA